MAIVKMNKISAIGLNAVKTELIKELMDLGVVEISSQDSKLTDQDWISYIEKDGNENEVQKYDSKLVKINQVIESLEKYDTSKKPMFKTRKTISENEFETILANKDKMEENADYMLNLINQLNELSTEENKIISNVISLKPWIGYEIPLDLNETKYVSFFLGIVPNLVNIENLKSEIEEKTNRCYINLVSSDKDQHYLSIVCMKSEKEDIYDMLKQFGFNLVSFKDLSGTVSNNIVEYENKIKEISVSRANIESEVTKSVQYKGEIQLFYDYLSIERDRCKILSNMLKTEKTFYINGWIPEKSKEKVESVLKRNDCWYEFEEPEKGEQYPILLNNNSFAEPFESITELYSLPSFSNMDPTAIMAPFYFLFFGLMLADVGYGLIMAIACYMVLRKNKIEGTLRKMLKMFFYCGISTAFWGVMFGSWFGDAIPAVAKVFFNADFNIKAIWINPMDEPMTLLIFSFLFGVVHLFVGMGMKAYMLIKDGKVLDALFDIGLWYVFIIGLGLLLFGESIIPGLGLVGKWLSIIGAVGLILTQGREKTNIIGKLFGGIMSLYSITSYLSDILSYSRLLALGLATAVVSSVVSILGSMGGDGFFGIIIFIIVLTIGHTFNIAINALGAFVHAARLQYVEFFGKFYEGGGEAFNPLIKKTKYINIIKEEI
jgi:V/A-type H+/Na+-transporting ATPase subunit I